MLNIEKIKLDIVKKLKPLNPYQIILFGSYAYGTPTKDSDLDISVIEKGEVLNIPSFKSLDEALYNFISKPIYIK